MICTENHDKTTVASVFRLLALCSRFAHHFPHILHVDLTCHFASCTDFAGWRPVASCISQAQGMAQRADGPDSCQEQWPSCLSECSCFISKPLLSLKGKDLFCCV